MFIVVYEFEIKDGTETSFREAWLEVTKAIYEHGGSFGSRLHTSDRPNILVGYAQWPNREQWEKNHQIADESYQKARNEMRICLIRSTTVYKLEVSDNYLQPNLALNSSSGSRGYLTPSLTTPCMRLCTGRFNGSGEA